MKIIRVSAVWCPSCLYTYHIYQSIQKKYPDIVYQEYDYDMDDEIVSTYQIGNVLPVHIFLVEEEEVGRLIGEKKETDFIDIIEQNREL